VSCTDIPDQDKKFIDKNVNSVEQLEVLLFLHDHPNKEWSATEIGRELRIDPDSAATRLADLHSQGLLKTSGSIPPLYLYNPINSELNRVVDTISKTYLKHRYTIINLIFSKPIDKVCTFADAFKIKREEE
jgi:hypothetical protein